MDPEFATTVREARKLIHSASKCYTYTVIGPDTAVAVEVSKAALLRALSELGADAPCGGIYWPDQKEFQLDRVV